MAYDRDKLEKQAEEIVKAKNIMFISHLVAFLPCSSSTFYEMGLEKSEIIKEAIYKNRSDGKQKIIDSLVDSACESKNVGEKVLALKLLADKNDNIRDLLADKQEIDHHGFSLFYEEVEKKTKKMNKAPKK